MANDTAKEFKLVICPTWPLVFSFEADEILGPSRLSLSLLSRSLIIRNSEAIAFTPVFK